MGWTRKKDTKALGLPCEHAFLFLIICHARNTCCTIAVDTPALPTYTGAHPTGYDIFLDTAIMAECTGHSLGGRYETERRDEPHDVPGGISVAGAAHGVGRDTDRGTAWRGEGPARHLCLRRDRRE